MRCTTSFFRKNPHRAKGDNVSFAASSLEYVTVGVVPNSNTDNFHDKFDGTLRDSDDNPKQSQQENDNAKNTRVDDENNNKETIETTGVNHIQEPIKKIGVEEPIKDTSPSKPANTCFL